MRIFRRVGAVSLAAALVAALTSCDDQSPPEQDPVSVTWTEHPLPAPDGLPGRSVVRDAVECGDGWWVVGAVVLDHPTETRDTRPAAWFSTDRTSWTSVPVDARTYWGKRAIINSVACSRDRVAMLGARSGGAHGNPRVTSFRQAGDRPGAGLLDVSAVFIQFGGVTATNVGPVSGGPEGWLITGNRISGPGVWVTDDPREFTRVEAEAGLTDDGDLQSITQGGGWAGDEWIVVGGGARTGRGLDPDPLAWTSPDGLTWAPRRCRPRRPSRTPSGSSCWTTTGCWWSGAVATTSPPGCATTRARTAGGTTPSPSGRSRPAGGGAPYVASLGRTPLGVLATVSTGDHYELWRTDDGRTWGRVEVPLEPPTAGDHTLVAADGDALLLVGDAGDGGHVWTAEPTS